MGSNYRAYAKASLLFEHVAARRGVPSPEVRERPAERQSATTLAASGPRQRAVASRGRLALL
eukprot:scaffold6541_cov30-Tisochrysis_lutea.AAC.2